MDFWRTGLEKILALLPQIVSAVLIFAFSLFLARLLERGMRRFLQRDERRDSAAVTLLGQIFRWGVIVLGALAALNRFFDVTAFVAGLGVAGLAIGFALQDILQNLVAGLILLLQHPFDVGESVELDGEGGVVQGIDLRATELHTWDGRILILPNATVLGGTIINYSRAPRRRVEVAIGIGYEADLAVAREVLLEAVREMDGVLSDPPPTVRFQGFGESSVDLKLYFWIDTDKTGIFQAQDEAIVRAKTALDVAGVEIPFPIRTIYMAK